MTDPVDINVIVTRLLGEVPLVVAFIIFSVKIITIYQTAQKETVDNFQKAQSVLTASTQQAQREASERTEKMIVTITSQWAANCDRRDLEMRTFLQAVRDQDTKILQRLSEDIKANTQALHLLQTQFAYNAPHQQAPQAKSPRSSKGVE